MQLITNALILLLTTSAAAATAPTTPPTSHQLTHQNTYRHHPVRVVNSTATGPGAVANVRVSHPPFSIPSSLPIPYPVLYQSQ